MHNVSGLKEMGFEQEVEEYHNDKLSDSDLENMIKTFVRNKLEKNHVFVFETDVNQFWDPQFDHAWEFMEFMDDNINIFGPDYWEVNFEERTPTPYLHLAGIKMASKYAKEKGILQPDGNGGFVRMEPSETL
jgi:hypothetical protein